MLTLNMAHYKDITEGCHFISTVNIYEKWLTRLNVCIRNYLCKSINFVFTDEMPDKLSPI